MKKLFRNLMLVAVAAMAFVACSEVSVEVDNIKRNYVFDVNAGINNDTRAYFGEAADGIYPIYWDGTESVRFEAQGDYGDGTTGPYGTMSNKMTISDDATRAMFQIEFYDATVLIPGTIDAYMGAIDYFGNLSISGNTQTPNVNSIDKEYFALKAEFPYDGESTTLVGDFVHLSAYSKMTVEGFDDVELDNVAIISDDNRYNLNVNGLDTKTYWFAAEPDANVNNLTIEATTVDGVLYTKTYTLADGKLAFNAGRISNFTAKGFEKYVAPAFTSENTMSVDSSWNYVDEVISYSDVLMIFSSEELGTLQLNFYYAFEGFFITPGTFYVDNNQIYIDGTDYSYYKPAGSETKYQLNGGSVIVSVTEDKKYHFEFKDITYNGSNTLNSTYTGDIDGFGMPDTREKLPTPEVNTPTVNGKEITLTWSDVNGADGYYVYCIQDSTINTTTTEHTATFTMPAYGTPYTFMIKAIANDDNPTYRSSDETNFTTVETGSDPNKFADYMATNIAWNPSNTCFDISVDGVDGAKIQVNAANRANNNSLTLGDYSYGTGEMQFRFASSGWSYTDYKNISMNVSIVDGKYRILITVGSDGWSSNFEGSIGYLGMPEGWAAPGGGEGGEEPEQPELTALATPELTVTVSGNTVNASWNPVTGAANYTVTLNGENKGTITETSISFSDLAYSTEYTVTVVANPADSTANTASEAASKSVTTEANTGGGDEPATDFIDWHFSANYNTGNRVVTLTGKDDSRVITVKTNELAFAKFYADTTRSSYFTDATVDGVATSDVTAESYVHIQQNQVSINLVINGITYTGNSDGFTY